MKNHIFNLIFCVLILTGFVKEAYSMELSVAVDVPGAVIYENDPAGVIRRSDSQDQIKIRIGSSYPDNVSRFTIIPSDATNPATVTLVFHIDNISLAEQSHDGFITPEKVANSILFDSSKPIILGYQLGTGVGDFLHFKVTTQVCLGCSSNQYYHTLETFFLDVFSTPWQAFLSLDFEPPIYVKDDERSNEGIDHWFVLRRHRFRDSCTNGSPWPEYGCLIGEPMPKETVGISGQNLVFEPDSAMTDQNGVFGVAVFVDPNLFYPEIKQGGGLAKQGDGLVPLAAAKEAAQQSGTLTISHNNQPLNEQKISGPFCQVIMVEGEVNVVYGDKVKVNDILRPGMKLSLSSGYGKKAQLGLRFINGSETQIIQDVYTNACLADIITIGKEGIENNSVIKGKNALATFSTYLCEEVAGMPNTPAEWEKAVGKFVIKTAASTVVPGSGIVAWAVKHEVKNVAGKAYD